ncbi:MAG: phytanoyl-CoA dioxygenase family protein [Acidimicrobiales bacterium]
MKPVLTSAQVDEYRTSGFVVLPGLLGERTAPLRSEVDAALHDAYAATYDERVFDGISGHYLPMASRHTPVSASLVCDDPVVLDAAEQLLGGPALPECPEGILYFGEAGWHNDDGIGVSGVKFATYFEPLHAGNGALRFLPGSQKAEETARLVAARPGPKVAGFAVDTQPGDVVAFDLHTWHASFGGRDRLAWAVIYLRCPETDEQQGRTQRSMTDGFEQACRGFDRDRYPIWRDWLAGAATRPRRTAVAARLRDAGVLGLPGADIGW